MVKRFKIKFRYLDDNSKMVWVIYKFGESGARLSETFHELYGYEKTELISVELDDDEN